jgi:hypothetical protein
VFASAGKIFMLGLSGGNLAVDLFEIIIALCGVWIITSEIVRRMSRR